MGAAPLATTWRDFEEVCARLTAAFPDSPAHAAIARRWLMRRPSNAYDHCPACGQPRADAIGRPTHHHVKRVVGATMEHEGPRFVSADWTVAPDRLDRFIRDMATRWLCGACATSIVLAFTAAAEGASVDRVFADLRRALEGTPLLATAEAWRAGSTPPVLGYALCGFCGEERMAFQLPWFRICQRCAAAANRALPL